METRTFKEEIWIPYKNKNERILKQLYAMITGIVLSMLIITYYHQIPASNILLAVITIAWLFVYAFYNFNGYTKEVISEYKINEDRICITHALCITSKGKFRRIQKNFYFSDIRQIEYEEDYKRVTIWGKGTQKVYKVNEYGDKTGSSQPERTECIKDEFYMKPSRYKKLKKFLKNQENILFCDYFF